MLHRGTKTAETEIFSAIAVGYKAGESTFEYYRHFPQFARFGKRNFPACGFAVGLRFQRAGSREMCGRFVRAKAPELYGQLFGVDSVPDIPSFNIAPTQMIAVVRMQEDHKVCVSLRWGMIPFWAKDKKTSYINARGDTVASKPAFRAAFKKRRCLILADGYYEWKAEGKKKQPYYYSMKDDQPIALAGIWDSWTNKDESDAQPIESCARRSRLKWAFATTTGFCGRSWRKERSFMKRKTISCAGQTNPDGPRFEVSPKRENSNSAIRRHSTLPSAPWEGNRACVSRNTRKPRQ